MPLALKLVLLVVSAALFFGGREISRKLTVEETVFKVMNPSGTKLPKSLKLKRAGTNVLMITAGVLTSMSGALLVQ